jgi:S-adenosylmethionine/arginine decarboxylase-like enzyme
MGETAWLERFIRLVADRAGMRIMSISSAFIEQELAKLGEQAFADEGGISIQALISTSHIALHTWPARNLFMFDLVSCKAFDAKAIRAFVLDDLAVKEIVTEGSVRP